MYILLWISAIGECCRHTRIKLVVNVEKWKSYWHVIVDVDIYTRIFVNVGILNTVLVNVKIGYV
jgi:hypothetical protein